MRPYDPAPRRPLSPGERAGVGLFALFLVGLVVGELSSDFTPAKLSVLFIVISWPPLLVLHELGHALAARLCGFRVHEMVLGFGPELLRFRALGAQVTVRAILVEGYVVPVPRSLERVRAKNAFVYFGGPGAELLFAGLLLLWLGPETMFSRSEALGVIAAQSAAVSAMLGVAMTLLPHSAAGSPSDGMGILLSASLSDEHFAWRMAHPTTRDAERLIDAERSELAIALVEQQLDAAPDNPFLRAILARCRAASGDSEGAVELLEDLRERAAGLELVEAERLHAAACVVLDTRDWDYVRDAERSCRAALERVPGAPDYQVTLGAVLLQQGRFEEARSQLQTAFKRSRDPCIEERCLAYLALVARGTGKKEDEALFRHAFEAHSESRRLRAALDRGYL